MRQEMTTGTDVWPGRTVEGDPWPDDARAIAEWGGMPRGLRAEEDGQVPGFWSAAGMSVVGLLVLLGALVTGQAWLAVFGVALALMGIALIAA